MAPARLILHEKQVDEDGAVIEMKIWSVPASSRHPHAVKYSLVYIRSGKRVLGYGNAHGQDHKHSLRGSQPYHFTNIRSLLRDFLRELERMKREEKQ